MSQLALNPQPGQQLLSDLHRNTKQTGRGSALVGTLYFITEP